MLHQDRLVIKGVKSTTIIITIIFIWGYLASHHRRCCLFCCNLGTGKTETTKDLAKAMGLLCIVTNCGEGMDFRLVGFILAGLVQCGAWGNFIYNDTGK